MLKLVYFASLRERLSLDSESLEQPEGVTTVADLIDYLVAERGEIWQQVLQDAQVLAAVNQEMCDFDQGITSGDEVAFFPPVTGG
ncbi:molybdopterin converting factor subunit 1 [Neptuniibacter sp.]|uniref:molybdopterin converting factor subunit 1 n=1 Tax=Neptuniibacter sp. TaxID=1962643 RepID=UPI002626DA16|nr:molybdopterin converting factor subunit 1 [Neptuniibacter sp.]MCP4595617.1 molybdopterin converting factor subunit 1 [Neptuniibacter sp.]